MDAGIAAAARALAGGDPVAALARVGRREDPPALALRGVAMAQLGDLGRASALLRTAARAFGPREELARARCRLADAEVALARRELEPSPRWLEAAIAVLEAYGDEANALHGRLLATRRLLLLGRVDEAGRALARLELHGSPPVLEAIAELVAAEVARRRIRPSAARAALARAREAALRASIPALLAEIDAAAATLDRAAARRIASNEERLLRLDEVEALLASDALVVDACRRVVRCAGAAVSFARRPVLFALARALGEAPADGATREALIARAFGARRPNESHRARLRVELGRLRRLVVPFARIHATPTGYALAPERSAERVVLAPPIEGEEASLLALLADGEAWSTSALALALGESQRSVQRALAALEAEGSVRAIGRARARRWVAPPLVDFATTLLLPVSMRNP